ncbi:hypothetical protein [Tellurirhabdus bombi]|uniref:hypothetical protein n=1 Tax=Tellurirhabdus bombi TaxID=2907205 RepID=UPI001F44EACB|nr:hypothetical protein [Tellurirhabdus bombi]
MKTGQYLTVEIPVYPVVKKYLSKYYQTEPYFVVSVDANPFACFLHAHLERRTTTRDEPKDFDDLTDRLTLGISHWTVRHGFGQHIAPVKIRAFNVFVKKVFLTELVREVDIRSARGEKTTAIIRDILERFRLEEDDFPFRTAERYYQRAKNEPHSVG